MVTCDTGIPTGVHREGAKTRIGVPAVNVLEKYSIPYPIFDPISLRRTLKDVLASADAVHVHGMLFMSSVVAARMGRRLHLPVVLTEHVGWVPFRHPLLDAAQRVAFETIGRLCCRQVDAITVLNDRVERELRRLTHWRAPIAKVPNGVDTELFHPPSPGTRESLRRKWGFERFAALFVGRFVPKKGVPLLLEARASDFELVLCGDQLDGANLRTLGKLDQRTLAEVYRAADVLVLPSEGEGFPLVVQEAMASGLPVIVTDNPENREYLDETVARFVARDPLEIREAIRSFVRNPGLKGRMGAAARRWAVERFDWERCVDRYLELYSVHGNGRQKGA
jgi:glycosyltransferase involved in cell wall biosynthesis